MLATADGSGNTDFTPFLLCSDTELFSWVIVSVLDLVIEFALCT